MAAALEFILNGRPIRAERCSPNTTLLEFLRAAGLTGSKEGCAEGDCGACSVAILDNDARGQSAWRAINSCLAPVCLLAGRRSSPSKGSAARAAFMPCNARWRSGTARNAATARPASSVRSWRATTATISKRPTTWTTSFPATSAAAPVTGPSAPPPPPRSPSGTPATMTTRSPPV